MTSAMSSIRTSKPSVGPYWRDSARFSLDISAFMRSKRSCGKLSVAGRPPARDITSGRAVRLIRSRMADDRMTPVRSAYLSSYLSSPRLVMPPSLSRLRIAASIGARPGWGNPDAPPCAHVVHFSPWNSSSTASLPKQGWGQVFLDSPASARSCPWACWDLPPIWTYGRVWTWEEPLSHFWRTPGDRSAPHPRCLRDGRGQGAAAGLHPGCGGHTVAGDRRSTDLCSHHAKPGDRRADGFRTGRRGNRRDRARRQDGGPGRSDHHRSGSSQPLH